MPKSSHDSYLMRIHTLHQQAVRDLAWCCFSAPLMHSLPDSEIQILSVGQENLWRWLQLLDEDPEALLTHLAQMKSTRLGIYYEALWTFYFMHHPDWELLQHNFQINRDGITLGAFDFLCRYKSEYFHIETAVKFYLCNATSEPDALRWNTWLGPNSNDRLDIKLTHLVQHQLPLHQLPEAVAQLQKLHPNISDWQTGLCMQGYFFSQAPTQYYPECSAQKHPHGFWWHLQDFIQYALEHPNTYWLILERQQWLSPAHTTDTKSLFNTSEIIAHLTEFTELKKRPLLIATMIKTEIVQYSAAVWRECLRGFVVVNDWPAH